jgi:DNA-binding response OmpR family regulator
MRILLVEDDKILADALSRALVQSAHMASWPTRRWPAL